jgi:hypothetical protein
VWSAWWRRLERLDAASGSFQVEIAECLLGCLLGQPLTLLLLVL